MAAARSPHYTEEHDALRDTVRKFVARHITPHVDAWEAAKSFPRELYKQAGDVGLLGIGFPEDVGGMGGDEFHRIVVTEELTRCGSGGVVAGLMSHAIGLPPIVALGSEQLRQRIAPAVIAGDKICALAITEPGGGSDVANLQTTAKADGDHFVLNGSKTFITSGVRADVITVAVRTGGEGMGGISLIVVEGDTPGLDRTPIDKMGWRSSDTATLYFDDCRVPAGNLVGGVNEGFRGIMNNFNGERLSIAAMAYGFSKVCYDEALAYATIRALVDNLGVPHVLPPVTSHDQRLLPASMAAERVASMQGEQLRNAIETRAAELLHADRTYCLFYDAESNALWREGCEIDGDRFTAAEGLAALAARCGQTFCAPNVGFDPRYVRHRDDPFGQGNEQLLLQPVPSRTGEIHAVLVVVRRAEIVRFSPDDIARAQQYAAALTGLLDAYDAAQSAEDTGVSHPLSIFRKEALEAHDAPAVEGDVVRVSPRWVSAVYKVTLAMAAVALMYICFGTVGTYREGPAIVQIRGRTSVTTTLGGTISEVLVRDGQFVEQGTPLVRLDDHREQAGFARYKEQFEQALTNVLRNPGDETARLRVAELKAQLVSARAELEDRQIVAPHDGMVRGMRVRPGQHLDPGDGIATVVENETELSLVAMIPGDAGPMLRPGQNLRLELTTHGRAFQDLTVESIDDEIIGPTEARRFLGPELADAIPLGGPVVLVRTKLPSSEFELDGTVYHYREGMSGTARIRLRDEPIIFAILPALREVI